MIWIRRFFAVIFGIIFIVLLPVVLLVMRVNSTLLEPGFYVEQLRKSDIFNFAYDQVIPVAIDDNIKDQDIPLDVTIKGNDIAQAMRKALPPEWLQSQAEQVFNQAIPYATGRTDHFEIELTVTDRIKAMSPALKETLVKTNAYNVMASQEFADRMDKYIKDSGALPFGVQVTGKSAASLFLEVFPPAWQQQRVEENIDSVTSYLTSTQQTIVRLPLKDRVQAALGGPNAPVKKFLREIGAYDSVYKEGIVPQLVDGVIEEKGTLNIPVSQNVQINISKDELVAALQKVPPGELQALVERYIDQLTPYLTGEAEHFRIELSSADAVRLGTPVIKDLVFLAAKRTYDGLPACNPTQALDLAVNGIKDTKQLCRPPGFSLQQVQAVLGVPGPTQTQAQLEKLCGCSLAVALQPVSFEDLLKLTAYDLDKQVADLVKGFFPGSVAFTDADLEGNLNPDDRDTLNDALGWIRNGLVYTDADLRKTLREQDNAFEDPDNFLNVSSNEEALDKVLKWTRRGVSFTDQDLRELLAKNDSQASENLDQVRSTVSTVRKFLPLLYVVPALLLLIIAFLGGRKWRSRIAWGAAFLLIASAITYAATGPVYRAVVEPIIRDSMQENITTTDKLTSIVTEKASDMGLTAIADFFSGIERTALLLLVLSVLAIAGTIVWTIVGKNRPPKPEKAKENTKQGEPNAGPNSANA